jgi:hypothetical protein
MNQIIKLLSLVLLTLTCCNNQQKSNKSLNTPIQQEAVAKKAPNRIEYVDTIHYDNVYYPKDTQYIFKILTTGIFHGDEVWQTASNENWFGLFKNKGGFYLSETKILTKKIHDPIIDENELDSTGWQVNTVNSDTSLILIQTLEYLESQPVEYFVLSNDQIFPGDTIKFNFLGQDYVLYATGGKRKVQISPEWFEVWNYKLYLTGIKNGKRINDLLVAQSAFDNEMINILFIGDIDGDKLLDLIIDTSGDYNATCPTLYLSKPSEKGHLLKVIGRHVSVGC